MKAVRTLQEHQERQKETFIRVCGSVRRLQSGSGRNSSIRNQTSEEGEIYSLGFDFDPAAHHLRRRDF